MYSNVFFAQNMFMFYAADSGSEKMQIRIDSTEEGIQYILQYYYSRQIWNIIVINHTSWAVGCSDAGTRRTGCINLAWHCCCLPVRRKNFFCIVKASLSIRINFMLGCVVYVSISVVCCVLRRATRCEKHVSLYSSARYSMSMVKPDTYRRKYTECWNNLHF